ncbi:MAG TPA: FtsX-like permease family protein [Nitrospiria bacterium]|nr:FtsX-like permease family protein [Nitrospiria bacterium]
MAWRETRGSFRHFLFFLVCIALGVGALVGVTGFSADLEQTIRREARALLAADVEVRANRPLSDAALAQLESLRARGIRWTTVSEMVAMASDPRTGATQLVELKAVGPGYPFYGRLAAEPAGAVGRLADSGAALAEQGLLARLGLKVGDRIRLGTTELTLAGVLTKEPDRIAGAFSLGPRVMIAQRALPTTALVQPGSRVRYRYLLKLPAGERATALAEELKHSLSAEGAEVDAYDDAQPRLRRFLANLTTYVGLVGLIALLIGGIGVANSVQAFMKERVDTLAVLKCVGAGSRTLVTIYLLQTLLLGALGSLAGIFLGLGVEARLPGLMGGLLPVTIERSLSPLSMARGAAMGILTALLFALWPLLGIRRVPPARLFRREVSGEEGEAWTGGRSLWRDRSRWLAALVIVIALAGLLLWQIGSLRIGATFLGVLAFSLLLLAAGARGVIALVSRWAGQSAPRSLAIRQGLANLYRPGSQAATAILSVGVGVTVIVAIVVVEASLMRQIEENLPTQAPSFFFIDIQRDQRDAFARFFADRHLPAELTPIARARLQAVDDQTVNAMKLEGRPDAWFFQREYVVTVQSALPKGNRIIAGQWWDDGATPASPQVSVEEDAAHHLGVTVGSTLTFDLQGQMVKATVTSLREVNWGSLTTNFFVIFSPGALDETAMTSIATVRVPPSEDETIQQAVVAAFPNVTAINIRYVLDAIGSVLTRLGRVVRLMALFSVAAGLLVLAGAIATSRYRRLREAVILKTLGATRGVIVRIFAVEYACLGATAGLIGAALASLLAFILLHFFLDLPWSLEPVRLAAGASGALLLTILTGFLATYRLLGRKPLTVLREE